MQKLEKSLKSIKFFFNNHSFFWTVFGYVFYSALFIICIIYYEDFFNYIYSPIPAVTLEDYTHNQSPLIRLIIKLIFDEPPYNNKNWAIPSDSIRMFPNRNPDPELCRLDYFDRHHFYKTECWVNWQLRGNTVLWDPTTWRKIEPCPLWWGHEIYKVWKYSQQEIDRVWPGVIGDEWELLICYKWFHNVLEFPFAVFFKWFLDPFLESYLDPVCRYFAVVNFKRDFIQRLPEEGAEYDSILLIPIIEFVLAIKFFFNTTLYDFFLKDIPYFIYDFFFSKLILSIRFYGGCCKFAHCNLAEVFTNFSIGNFFIEYILSFFSSIIFNFFSLIGFNFFLNINFELIFLEHFFFVYFSYISAICLLNTVLNVDFWVGFVSFVLWVNDVLKIYFFGAILFLIYKIFLLLTFLPRLLWKYFLRNFWIEGPLLETRLFFKRTYKSYLKYKELYQDLASGEYYFKRG